MSTTENPPGYPDAGMRPAVVFPVSLAEALQELPERLRSIRSGSGERGDFDVLISGVAVDTRMVRPGDVYIALPGARTHGAAFTADALRAGASAVITDDGGLRTAAAALAGRGVPLFLGEGLRQLVGPLSGVVLGSQPATGPRPVLFGVTGTNGKTTTTYFINSLLAALGRTTGLIGTIEISAGGEPIPSALTTPESPQVHGILALMRERHLDAAAMEVSSHAIDYQRVDGVVFDVAGFTNLTQDHLDLHGTMEDYFLSKATLFQPDRARTAVIAVDDEWGRRLAAMVGMASLTLSTAGGTSGAADSAADWMVADVVRDGLGHRFRILGPGGAVLSLSAGLPGRFNVSNAALAAVMVLASGVSAADVQLAADAHDPFTVKVPGRMQLIGERPAAIVDFAHNPDALARTLESVRRPEPGARVIVVFGATGQRDQTKRPVMGATAARLADVVIVTDDDPHDEDEAQIRRGVLDGALAARAEEQLACEILEVFPRAEAIERAVSMARGADTVLVAGRGHEVWQEVKGVNLALDDRVELAAALTRHGFSVLPGNTIES